MQDDARRQTGAAVRGYRVERLLGVGGAAAVYEVRRLGTRDRGERLACKIVHAERRGEPRHRESARREAVLGLRVTAGHRNLVEILDFFDDAEAQHCIVMALVDGASAAELRGPDRRLSFPVVRRVAVEVLEALAYLHGRGVLHRDLSLRNILVTSGGAVKVADLGTARVMEGGEVHTQNCLGTPMYVAREAIELLPLDARADMFSLGAILYELVTGTPPCGVQRSAAAMLARNVVGDFAPLPADTPADLAEMITGLIRRERDARRPQTAIEALAMLRDRGQPVASEVELAGIVAAAQARRAQESADAPPASPLPPGYVLAPRDAQEAADALAERMADRGAGARPRLMARGVADAVPHHVSDPLPEGMAERAAEHAAGRLAERVIDVAVEGVGDAPPGRVTASIAGRAGEAAGRRARSAARRGVAGRAVLWAALAMCLLVPAVLLDDGFHGERGAIEPAPPAGTPALVVVPAPALPVSPVVVAPAPAPEAPRQVADPADERRRERTEAQGRDRQAGTSAPRWRAAPHLSRPPPWGNR